MHGLTQTLRRHGEEPLVLVTGSSGTIGGVLARSWPAERLRPFDLPDSDARDPQKLAGAARRCDAIVHLAWDACAENHQNGRWLPDNSLMNVNAMQVAADVGVRRVVIASSVHADTFWPPSPDPVDPARSPTPDSPYGASKVFAEAAGRYFAAHHGLEVVVIRFGGVNSADRQPSQASERAVWLPHRDCVSALHAAIHAPLPAERFALIVAVGDGPERVHSYGEDPIWPPEHSAPRRTAGRQ